ncbi:MAG: hypothetical protein CMH57_14780 [Myxococcales bacterium]|nr:hypothetical protein [Myxococcales bacterium]
MEHRPGPSLSLRKKLEYLMVIRVLMVTLLLGSAIIVNINDVDSFADPSYLAIATLIIATYVATIIYAVLVPRLQSLVSLTYVQLIGDVALSAGLIILTGGSKSIFSFLLYLTIINAAIVLGQSGAFIIATLSCLVLVGILLQGLGFWGIATGELGLPKHIAPATIYNPVVHIFACYLVSFLAGHLAWRLEEQGTELERRKLDIAELQALTHNILSSISEGVLTLDNKRRILFLNHGGERLLQRVSDEIYGLEVRGCLPELAGAVEELTDEASRRSEWSGWIQRPLDEEVRYLSVSHSQLYNVEDKPYGHIFILKDLTEVHSMEQRMRRQERLAAVGQLAAGIAHEIRNPLASISGSIEMLQAVSQVDEDEQRLMTIVIREVERLNSLIENFLDYSKPSRRDPAQVVIFEVVRETTELFGRDTALVGDIQLDADIEAARACVVMGDSEALRQVFWNLLRNAAQAIEAGEGRIEVRAETFRGVRLRDRSWERLADQGGEHNALRLTVSDTGKGIPGELLEQIFEPFFTTKSKGTGLGLATINRIIEDHDGFIGVTSEVGEGSLFEVVLPFERDPRLTEGASGAGSAASIHVDTVDVVAPAVEVSEQLVSWK